MRVHGFEGSRTLFSARGYAPMRVFGLEGLFVLFASDEGARCVEGSMKHNKGLDLNSTNHLAHRLVVSGEHDAILIVNL